MKRILTAIALLAALCACSPDVVILHVNDTHSHLDPERGGDSAGRGGIIERAAMVDSVRAKYGADRVLLLHAGDFNQGTSYFTRLGGEVEVNEVNAMGYDCITLGNHEFDNGLEDLDARLRRLSCKVVCANADLSPFGMDEYVKPYAVFERGRHRIGVIGLTCILKGMVSTPIASRVPQLDAAEVVNKWSEVVRRDEKCDFVLVLSHLGFQEDCELAAEIHGVDAIIGGHSHTFIEQPEIINDADGKPVSIVTAGCFGLEIGELKIR